MSAATLPLPDPPERESTDDEWEQIEHRARRQVALILDGDAYDELVRLAQHGISARLLAYAAGTRPIIHDDPDLTKRTMRLLHSADVEVAS